MQGITQILRRTQLQGQKEQRGEYFRVSKDSGSGEKRKLDSRDNKDSFGSGNGEYLEEYSSSKRFKERAEDGVNDRWNGGDDDKGSLPSTLSILSRSLGLSCIPILETKPQERLVLVIFWIDFFIKAKRGLANVTSVTHLIGSGMKIMRFTLSFVTGLPLGVEGTRSIAKYELESLPDKRIRRKQDGSGDGDKHQDDIEDINDRRFSLREDGRPKDEKHKDERYRDKYREDKYRDERALKDHTNSRYKDSRGRKISPDDHEDYNDTKSRGVKTLYLDMEKKSSSSSRVESDADRGRSQSRQAHPDNNTSSNRKRASPTQVLMELQMSTELDDEDVGLFIIFCCRQFKPEELKHRDAVIEQRSKSISSREANNLPGASDRASKYRSAEKPTKVDDGHIGELSLERSSRSKASPMGLVDRSPTSSSMECRSMNRSGVRRSVDIEESGRRSSGSMGARDLPYADDRSNRDLPLEKSLADESTSVDSSFYNRHSQSNSALIPPSAFRGGVGSPSFLGSLDEDCRIKSGARYKRSADSNMGRGQGNAWRGAPNWSHLCQMATFLSNMGHLMEVFKP
ncbi:hypothetical protein GH714_039902 [Hevea brasiliensis]|uniref:Uncharacterized protein n=1 Tax=Hevea brasiliensis TaxID=3981 RepID=A0A6A6KHQ8_HEVBR|nr:hypothetical protein GH714_039902 [Hevea brasiliensis]